MIITDQKALNAFCKKLKNADFLCVDTEFLREKTYYPKLCLIQVGDENKNAAAIDPLIEDLDLSPLYELLFDPNILKVFHAGRQDLEIFFKATGKVVSPLFDTQIAAMVCGYGDSIGYENLVKHTLGKSIDKSSQFTDWSLRPLSEKQIDYALGDVTHLADIYQKLSDDLTNRGRLSWVFEEEKILNDPATYENNPEEAWQRVKVKTPKARTLQVLKYLCAWRERRAQRKNLPKNWVMRDDTLADMAAQMPKTVPQLCKIRNMPKDLAEGKIGRELLSSIKEALEEPENEWPKPVRKERIPTEVSTGVDILKMLLRIKSTKHGVAAKLIANSDDLQDIARGHYDKTKSMQGWRRDVFGADALALIEGKIAIAMRNHEIVEIDITDHD